MDEVDGERSDLPAVMDVDRIATRHPGTASRVALRLLIVGSGVRPTGHGSDQFRHSGPVDRASCAVRSLLYPASFKTPATSDFTQPTKAEQAGGCDGEELPS